MKLSKAHLYILIVLSAVVAAALAQDIASQIIRYRYNTILSFDPTVKLVGEDGSWTNTSKQIGYLQNLTGDVQGQIDKKSFAYVGTNLVMWGQEAKVIGLVGAHTVQLPGASTNYGRSWKIIAVGTGTNGINKPDGVTSLAVNAATGNSSEVYSDGTNWWVVATH